MRIRLGRGLKKLARNLSKGVKDVGKGASKVTRGAGKAVKNIAKQGTKLATGSLKNSASPKKLAMQGLGGGMSSVADFAGKQGKMIRLPKFGGGRGKAVPLTGALSPSQVRNAMVAGPRAAGPRAINNKKEDEEEKMQKPFRRGGAVSKKPMASKTGRAVMRKTSDVKGRAMKKEY